MIRTALGWSLSILLVVGASGGCSSKEVNGGNGSAGGPGATFCDDLQAKLADCAIAMSVSISAADCSGRVEKYKDTAIADAAACLDGDCDAVVGCVNGAIPGTSSGTGGSGSGTGGTGSGGGGPSNTGGSGVSGGTSTAGTGGTGPACPTVCLDEMTAQYCDASGAMMTANCAEVFAEDGLVSNGCLADAMGEGCTIDDVTDMACGDGAGPFAFCNDLTEDDILDVYVGCFHDMNGAHTVIPCYTDFVMGTEEMPTIDCEAANAACLPTTM